MIDNIALLALVLAIAAAFVGDVEPRWNVRRVRALLDHRWAPLAAGVVSAAATAFMWGSLRATPVYHDEAAYVFQAQTFAKGWLAAPSPPIPEFFEQFHVFVTPTFSSKYPPGHALLMVPGVWLGLVGLVPVLLAGIAGGLLYALTRRVAGAWVAVLATTFWIVSPLAEQFRGSYFSEATTAALWLATWWFLLEYMDSARRRWLVALAVCVAWGAMTRPLTMLAFAAPTAVAVLVIVIRRRAWRDVLVATPAFLGVLAFLPVWNARVLGDWRKTPHAEYAREYIPADHVGFMEAVVAPARALPPDMREFNVWTDSVHKSHTLARLPQIAEARLHRIALVAWGQRWGVLSLGALVGLLVGGWAVSLVAGGAAVLLFAAYLLYAHEPVWVLYYYELVPVLMFFTALGVVRLGSVLASGVTAVSARFPAVRSYELARFVVVAGAVTAMAVTSWDTYLEMAQVRTLIGYERRYFDSFERALTAAKTYARGRKVMVFVRYADGHNMHRSLIANEPDLPASAVWIVRDRGDENHQLMRLAPDRVAMLYAEERVDGGLRWRLAPLAPAVDAVPASP